MEVYSHSGSLGTLLLTFTAYTRARSVWPTWVCLSRLSLPEHFPLYSPASLLPVHTPSIMMNAVHLDL